MKRAILASALLAFAAVGAHAQTPAAALDSLYRAAQTCWDNADYDGAFFAAQRGLLVPVPSRDPVRLECLRIVGFVYVARDLPGEARDAFKSILVASPRYKLGSVPDKIRKVWDEAVAAAALEPIPSDIQLDMRMSASWRSLVAPGWGQIYKTQSNKGTAIIAAQVLSLAALIYMQTEVHRRHDDYLRIKEYNDPDIQDRYDEYRRAYQMRNAVGYITLGIYVANYLDALYTPVKRPKKLP